MKPSDRTTCGALDVLFATKHYVQLTECVGCEGEGRVCRFCRVCRACTVCRMCGMCRLCMMCKVCRVCRLSLFCKVSRCVVYVYVV